MARTWSMAHDILHLWSHTLWGLTYYNFIRTALVERFGNVMTPGCSATS